MWLRRRVQIWEELRLLYCECHWLFGTMDAVHLCKLMPHFLFVLLEMKLIACK